MADEMAQICQLEIQGVTFVVKGTVAAAQAIMRMLKEIFNVSRDFKHWAEDKSLHRAGEKHTLSDILKLSEGGPPELLNVREEVLDELMGQAKSKGLHYALAVDFDTSDGFRQVMVPAQEFSALAAIYKAVCQKQLVEDRAVLDGHSKNVAETEEKLLGKTENAVGGLNPELKAEIDKLHVQLENYKQARDEAAKWVSYGEEVINSENLSISLMDYLKMAKGTEFEVNPEKAMAEWNMGVEIGKEMTLKELLQPVRDKSCMPESKMSFYVPKLGALITRAFNVDNETGLVYSTYALKTDKGETVNFSDRNMTAQQWNDKVLPELLDKAGSLEGTLCRVFDTQEKALDFGRYHDKVTPQSEIDIVNKVKAGEPVFSSAENEQEIKRAVSEMEKIRSSAKNNSTNITITAEPHQLTRQQGKLVLHLNETETLLFGSVQNEHMENGRCVFEIGEKDEVFHVKRSLQDPTRNQVMSISAAEGKQFADNLASASNPQVQAPVAAAHHKPGGR